jgi:hypothetical protein
MTRPIVRRRRSMTKFKSQGTEALYFRSANNKFVKIGSQKHDQFSRLKPELVHRHEANVCLSSSTFYLTG